MKIQKFILGLLLCGSASLNAYADGNALGNSELNERIAVLEDLVIKLQTQIHNNGSAGADNAQDISANSDAISASETEVANNAQDISANSDAISAAGNVLQYVSVIEGEVNGVVGPHFVFEGVNVHVRSGAGTTSEGCTGQDFDCEFRTGLGNLIIGYNEPRQPWIDGFGSYVAGQTSNDYASTAELCAPSAQPDFRDIDGFPLCDRREGSHGLVIGRWNNNMGHANFVAGLANDVGGHFVSIIGGQQNSATANYSAVTGGLLNRAYGFGSSVGGGYYNITGLVSDPSRGRFASVSGGTFNVAEGEKSSVSGGQDNFAGGFASSVSGGINSLALGSFSAVSGGDSHTVNGAASSISGGTMRNADADFCTVGDSAPDC